MHHGCESANLLMFMLCLLDALGCNAFTPHMWVQTINLCSSVAIITKLIHKVHSI